MHIIGVIGGVASGKSLVAKQLSDRGAVVLDADRLGHEVLRQEGVKAEVRRRWSDEVFGPDGEIDRRRLARIVFAPSPEGPRERVYLEKLTHPEITRRLRQEISRLAADGQKLAVLDAPLLTEAGWDEFCNTIVFVDAPRDLRLSRAKSRGWNEENFTAREGAQDSLDSKRKRADVIIDNSQSTESTEAQIEQLMQSLVV